MREQEEEQLRRVRTQSKDRRKDVETASVSGGGGAAEGGGEERNPSS